MPVRHMQFNRRKNIKGKNLKRIANIFLKIILWKMTLSYLRKHLGTKHFTSFIVFKQKEQKQK